LEKTKLKKQKTIEYERWALRGWTKSIGKLRLNDISFRDINIYIESRCEEGVSPRTINLGVIYLRNCLMFARQEGWFPGKLPTEGWKPLPYKPGKRPLFTKEQIDKLCTVALQKNEEGEFKYRNGEMLADAIRFMRASGARVTSALATRWSDVDWNNKQVHLRHTKYDKQIVVDFNPELEAVLRDMYQRRLPDSHYLFPATRKEGSVGSLRKTFELVRDEAGLQGLRFHDLRHHFASYCVISGVDFVTVANWLGHADTSLLGKTYAHLSRAHAQRAAQKVSFEVKSEPQAAGIDLSKISGLDLVQLIQKLQNPVGNSCNKEAPSDSQ
jgi:integrase